MTALNQQGKQDMTIPERILEQYRHTVSELRVFNVPIADMTMDELQCMLVMIAQRERQQMERRQQQSEFLRDFRWKE